ncbi:MAG: hypothetical protein HKN30_07400 [Sulfitobacter sp.]|nr:hypothetical protein [Sulfitobacter sp.]
MTEISVPAFEQGTTRVFALSLSDGAAQELREDPAAQAQIIGLDEVNSTGVEVFRLKDLSDLGLVGYLREGVDANEEDLQRDRRKLMALEGWVMLVHSSAFNDKSATLRPLPEATLIGTYAQEKPEAREILLESEAAQPYTGAPTDRPPQAPRGRASGSLVIVGLVMLVALVLWWVLS